MITIFTIPKPFSGHTGIIQKNAVRSWLKVTDPDNIILFGEEDGVEKVAEELSLTNQPVALNEYGTPLLDNAFKMANELSSSPFICYVNSDIILTLDILSALKEVSSCFNNFLIVGRRLDVDIGTPLSFNSAWETSLAHKGKLHGYSGIDFFLFPKDTFKTIPPFTVGRVGWDNWMIYSARRDKIPVVDVTPVFKALHQNHDYSHLGGGVRQRDSGREAALNKQLAGGTRHFYTIRDATYSLTSSGIKRNRSVYNVYRFLSETIGLHYLNIPRVALTRLFLKLTR